MGATKDGAAGHYDALGVSVAASQLQIERAFHDWTDRYRAGAAGVEAYRRAESAYHTLATPASRARHDRQLGLTAHPAWAGPRESMVKSCVREAVRELDHGHLDRARRLLDRAVVLAPEDPHARSYLALALVRTGGCLHAAARHGRFALERRPREPAFCFNLAEVYAAAGLHARAYGCRLRGWHGLGLSLFGRRREL